MRRVCIVGVGLLLASGCATSSIVADAPSPSNAVAIGTVDSASSSAVPELPTPSEAQVSPTLATMSVTRAAPPGAPKACTSAQLSITLGERQQVMAQPAIAIIFTNTGDAPCTLYGYPRVAGLNTDGHPTTQAYRIQQVYEGGASTDAPTPVTLTSGGPVSALIGGGANPLNGQTACPADYAAVLVTPPGATSPTKLQVDFPSCSGLEITPLVPGPTGGFFDPRSSP
jgi:hypothetical protein